MILITDHKAITADRAQIGGKASGLVRLAKLGLTVPKWAVIPADFLSSLIEPENSKEITAQISVLEIPNDLKTEIQNYFKDVKYLAVRSSAIDEDGGSFSFAGQFESRLFVEPQQLAEKIKEVWNSGYSERITHYRRLNNLPANPGFAIVIQEMINGEASGVGFGIDPVSGDENTKIINAVFGLGEGLVSGELNADVFRIKNEKITSEPVEKTHQVIQNPGEQGGVKLTELPAEKKHVPCLNDSQIKEVAQILDKSQKVLGGPQDLEFTILNNQVFVLQLRPVTSRTKTKTHEKHYVLWDNSNIIESYPGVTTPLTFSFITKSYENAYKLFVAYLGVSKKMISDHEQVFANTLGFINGRVYYNLRSWYLMLAMIPGYSINARYMETMMGVKERFDIPAEFLLSKTQAWWSVLRVAFNLTGKLFSLPSKRREFMRLLDKTIREYKNLPYPQLDSNELMHHYLRFEKKLLNEWKVPLLNDFFAMIWFGMLQGLCKKYKVSENPNIHNDLLCGNSDIISTQPIHRSIELASSIRKDASLSRLFKENDENQIWKSLVEDNRHPGIKKDIDAYIADFGERCVGELKLETISYSQNPALFIRVLKNYLDADFKISTSANRIDLELRLNAEKEVDRSLRSKPLKKWWFKKVLGMARQLVTARENLRYERTRAFGIVRQIFSHLGKRWHESGIIRDEKDIFYLTKEEIFAFIDGRSVTQNIQELIDLRKIEFAKFNQLPPPAERFGTFGVVYHSNDFFNKDKVETITGDLKGIGCCPGHIKGNVRVVLNPQETSSLNGDILVTSSTDPGWVTLFPSASAIIVERGSLLSHSAIVAREMGKPCIVGVSGLLRTLHTGDEIEMNGSTGHIKILKKA